MQSMRCFVLKTQHLSSLFPLSHLPFFFSSLLQRAFAMAASTRTTREASTTPPPVIGKAGRYTVFITPPSTPKPPQNAAESPKTPPPVQPPPQQFEKPASVARSSSGLGFFWNAIAKVQDDGWMVPITGLNSECLRDTISRGRCAVHSSVDEYLADWFGLNQSKYQWALNDYYESKGIEKEAGKPKEQSGKGLGV